MSADVAAVATPAELLSRWEAQQAAYVAFREERFAVMLEIVERVLPADFTALDLACGPGSLARRVLERFPAATVVALDHDPVLLRLAGLALAGHGKRLRLVDADLAHPGWTAALGDERPDVVLSSTALHWLLPDRLVDVYRAAVDRLAPGGLLLNADHLRFDARHPTLRTVAAGHDAAWQRKAHEAGAETWDGWWAAALGVPELAALAAERERRFGGRPAPGATAPDLHIAALRQAGCAEAGIAWQYLDDYVVFARR